MEERSNYRWEPSRPGVLSLKHTTTHEIVAAVYFGEPDESVLVNIWQSRGDLHPDSDNEYTTIEEAKAACEAVLWPEVRLSLDMLSVDRSQTLAGVARMWLAAGIHPITINGPDGEHSFTVEELTYELARGFLEHQEA